ncbi:MAG: response regulator [Bacteroidales bacterium]|jgi:two-component system LytT family response regulator|nr:response regulator [Bacteroidales bacterium]
MLRTIIIDDEAHIRDTLTRLLSKHCRQVKVVGEASGVAEGIRVIQTLYPDLLLLDINLNDGTGFDLIHSLNVIDFKIIFISACDKRKIQAFQLSNMEYLLKPIHPEDLKAAVRRVEETDQEDLVIQLKALEANV